MDDKLTQLKDILKDMFQMNNSDLDFGIYKIMNLKNSQISDFFDKKLDNNGLSRKEQDIIYSNMVEFFSRYYQNGDFVSQRRYKNGSTYSIPYDGEEVKLHWANADQYYIKTSENFKNYTFKTEFATVSFKIKEAETTTDNNKSQKRYFLFHSLHEDDKKLTLYFEYKDMKRKGQNLQDKVNFESFEEIKERCKLEDYGLSKLKPTEKDKTRTLLQKHLTKYTAKNSFDYFIHKDLGKFLKEELDNFIKSELIDLDDILGSNKEIKEEKFKRVKIFKDLSLDVITFLAQLEDFQKQLWEKKKFVVESNYCITLDKIDEKYHEEIFKNKGQLDEWQKLFSTKEKSDFLVVDTKFFSSDFKYKILSAFDNLDEEMDGVLINSENFGALNLLYERYKEQVKCVYIDPPYNTGNDGFLYSDSFQHSSWMSFMYDRLALGRELMSDDGVIFSSIDENEQNNFHRLLTIIYGNENFIADWIWQNKKGGGNDSKHVAIEHEYIKCFVKNKSLSNNFFQPYTKEYLKRYKEEDKTSKFFWDTFKRKSGKQYYAITCPDGMVVKDDELGNPISWLRSESRFLNDLEKGDAKFQKKTNGWSIMFKQRLPEGKKPRTILNDLGTTSTGNETLLNLFSNLPFSNPKPERLIKEVISYPSNNSTILDYFAGSGTTAHAVINLNRQDQGKRKYILVEMGEYFDTVTKPRVQKIIFSDSWKDGKPTTHNGISQMFKYFSLESYEETLNNLTIKENNNIPSLFASEYMLNYILDDETKTSQLDIDKFKKPFNYTLEISTGIVGETKTIKVDLVETFNYLIGIKVERIKSENSLVVVSGENLREERLLIIWRDEGAEISQELVTHFKEYDKVYINGDVDIDEENIYLLEKEFTTQMFKKL